MMMAVVNATKCKHQQAKSKLASLIMDVFFISPYLNPFATFALRKLLGKPLHDPKIFDNQWTFAYYRTFISSLSSSLAITRSNDLKKLTVRESAGQLKHTWNFQIRTPTTLLFVF